MRLWLGASAAFLVLAVAVGGRTAISGRQPVTEKRAHELTLAGLRPGRSTFRLAGRLYPQVSIVSPIGTSRLMDPCSHLALFLEGWKGPRIETIRVAEIESISGACEKDRGAQWIAGLGLRIGDSPQRVVALYGEPDSRSPSTREGKQLELLYYEFDWAGPDVPQVMQVLCTLEKDGRPGRVVEITLAASSL